MRMDLFSEPGRGDVETERLGAGAVVLRGFARPNETEILKALRGKRRADRPRRVELTINLTLRAAG